MNGVYMATAHDEEGEEWASACTKDSVLFPGACFEGKFTSPLKQGCRFSAAFCEAQQNIYKKSCYYGWGIQQHRSEIGIQTASTERQCDSLPEESDRLDCLSGALGMEALVRFGESEALNKWPFEKYCNKYQEGGSKHKKCVAMTRFGLYGFEPVLDKADDFYAEYVLMDKVAAL